jgi:hypothetical protein
MVVAWIFGGFWNLVSFPAAFFALRQALEQGRYAGLIALLFPAVGIGLLAWAVRSTLRYRRYGTSRLELTTVPAPVGRELRGIVVASGLLETRETLGVTLTCVRRVTRGAGKNRSTTETVLWQEEQRVRGTQSRRAEGMVTSVPVAFRIPADAEPADSTDPRDQVVWRLAVSADVPGVDYHSAFEVPVFRTADDGGGDGEAASSLAVQPFVQPPSSRIKVTRNRRGTEIVFPAARNPGASAGLTAFLAIWLLVVWALVHFEAPLLFRVIFAGFALLLVAAAAGSWFSVSRVSIGDGSVTVARGLFVPWREQRLAAGDIAEVRTRIGMQVGGTPYYDLMLVGNNGRKVPAGRAIRDKREAEWLADTVREALRA